jgi:8-oxo-dGTP diphosphatase
MVRYVLGFCFDPGWHNVLLFCKVRPEWQLGKLNGLGGHVEEGETPWRAMEREFDEETEGRLRGLVEWTVFARLRGEDFELWCFHSRFAVKFPCGLDGLVVRGEALRIIPTKEVHDYFAVPNLGYLLPMALNHARGIDRAVFFEVRETSVSSDCYLGGGGERG